MGYRIMQLQNDIMGRKYEVIQGIHFDINPKSFDFMRFTAYGPEEKGEMVTRVREYDIKDWEDGFKDIHLYLPEEDEELTEEGILLLIGYIPHIKTNAQKIAGRYSEEGVFLLKPGDKIEVYSRLLGNSSISSFAAIQYEGKMYLMKLYN